MDLKISNDKSINAILDGDKEVNIKDCINMLENSFRPKCKILCEPFLSKRNLYPKFTSKSGFKPLVMDVLTWCDGTNDIVDISNNLGVSISDVKKTIKILKKHKLIK